MKSKYLMLLFVLVLTSCASKKDLFYLQDAVENNETEIKYQSMTVQPNDILKIDIETLIPEAARPYNQSVTGSGAVPNLLVMQLEGYLVNKDGTINFHNLGEISVVNLTVVEVAEKLKNELTSGGHLNNPKVNVRIVNSKVTVLGEVRNPGTFPFTEHNVSLFQALGYAGDLTINGKRDDIIITREVDGSRQITHVDLTNTEFMNSEFYYLKPNDIIIVNPNKSKVTSSGYIGNIGILLSVTSVLLSSIILLSR
ncbi:polysaccharide biosynthesis/export family protein [Psychroserpens ponticola]|uniref:Polysaccharide biosynthesis/export family protein n=1 Tax=Psychroserpens ponticola TaxID=2932268 RepID=A0ABY7RVG9_9FLAO|nr:polysaccharide biosynthesis/export family protein [Psychroserpens ponticola]WCO01121.1 polysaccharide biosynthesis/export family protein [Psychroserpens ponticola]